MRSHCKSQLVAPLAWFPVSICLLNPLTAHKTHTHTQTHANKSKVPIQMVFSRTHILHPPDSVQTLRCFKVKHNLGYAPPPPLDRLEKPSPQVLQSLAALWSFCMGLSFNAFWCLEEKTNKQRTGLFGGAILPMFRRMLKTKNPEPECFDKLFNQLFFEDIAHGRLSLKYVCLFYLTHFPSSCVRACVCVHALLPLSAQKVVNVILDTCYFGWCFSDWCQLWLAYLLSRHRSAL